jgi:hypothetical protein
MGCSCRGRNEGQEGDEADDGMHGGTRGFYGCGIDGFEIDSAAQEV